MHRRNFLAAGAAGFAAAAAPRWTRAQASLGDMTLETLSDGHLTLPPEFIYGPMPQTELAGVLAAHGLSADTPLTPPCNVTLLRRPGAVVLFDAGAGAGFQSSAGALPDALDAAGLSPSDITHVVFTHAHPDHLWGVLDDFDDPAFPDAVHLIGRVERDYWLDPATPETIGAARQSFAAGAQRRLEALDGILEVFEDGDELLPGIRARASHGHTPGHMAFSLDDGGRGALILGDAIGNAHVALARPEWPSGADQVPEQAALTRGALLDEAAADSPLVVGFHLPNGGIGRIARDGDRYRFEPG